MDKRSRLSRLLRVKEDSSAPPVEVDEVELPDELDMKHLDDEAFEPIPDAIVYMFSLFEAA